MSLDKLKIPILSDSSRKFLPKEQRKSMNDPFVERTKNTRIKKEKKDSGVMVVTRNQKVSEDKRTSLEVEVCRSPPQVENQAGLRTEGNWIRRLLSESTPVEQSHDFATSAGTLDREDLSELSNISIEKLAVEGSPKNNTKIQRVTQKAATSSSFSQRVKNTLGKFFPFNMGTATGGEVDTREEDEDKRKNEKD